MIRIYCDRCGKVITPVPPLTEKQTARLEGEIQISITRIPKFIGYCPEQIDLCVDCRSKIKQMIIDFLADDNTECKKDEVDTMQ